MIAHGLEERVLEVGETLQLALEALVAAAPDWLTPLIDSEWVERYGAKIDHYRFPKGENVRRECAEQVGREGFTLLDAIADLYSPAWLGELPAVRIQRRAWAEQYHRDGQGVRWREARTSRRPETGCPRRMTPTPTTASNADRAGAARKSISARPANRTPRI
ncbi:hypothetical protein ACWCXB_09035 [Streptomyces sp. NPDC001514]